MRTHQYRIGLEQYRIGLEQYRIGLKPRATHAGNSVQWPERAALPLNCVISWSTMGSVRSQDGTGQQADVPCGAKAAPVRRERRLGAWPQSRLCPKRLVQRTGVALLLAHAVVAASAGRASVLHRREGHDNDHGRTCMSGESIEHRRKADDCTQSSIQAVSKSLSCV